MNLDGCTPKQRESIQHVHGPLLVSAGAGSGKTFTLTQRIAYALLPESGPAIESIDDVLAITFTDRAAAEMKARIKRTLRAEGLVEQALKVDAAWISTIHSMCARILRTHALDLGIDPAFTIMSDTDRKDALVSAIDEALGEDNDIVSHGSYAELFEEYTARSSSSRADTIASMLQTLLDKAAGLHGGLDVIESGPAPADASSLAHELLCAYENVAGPLEEAGDSNTAQDNRAQTKQAIEALNGFLLHGSSGASATSSTRDEFKQLAAVLEECGHLSASVNQKAKPAVKEFQLSYDRIVQQIALGLAYPAAEELLVLARDAKTRFENIKRDACKLDNDDLLIKTLEAFETHPDIAERYRDRFKLVMVDEFQDTSQLQVDLISYLAGDNLSRLCTVGDAQQSIYRFRGADVNVYEAHKHSMCAPEVGARSVELTKNFRSHADILSFVDRVFGQPDVFGEAFMPLEPDAQRPSRYKGRSPRVNLVLAMQPAGNNTGITGEDVRRACAQSVARQFAQLVEDGHAPNDMVILMGKMANAHLYEEALREQGLECVVAGGSQFSSAAEVQVIARLLEALANPANTEALFEVLSSDMVRLSSDDLLLLGTKADVERGQVSRRDIDRGFAELLARPSEELSPQLAHVVKLFDRAQRNLRTQPVATVVRDVVVQSGWMARLEQEGADGLAQAANILKAIRMIEERESRGCDGLASLARWFSGQLAEDLKESPGALSGEQGKAVRIMTIHASKGLEFPIVALADFADAKPRSHKLVAEVCGPVIRTSLMPSRTLKSYKHLDKYQNCLKPESLEGDPDFEAALRLIEGQQETCTQAAYRCALLQRSNDEELAEARRKMYVGLTRASEALIVAMDGKEHKDGSLPSYDPLINDIRTALLGDSDFPEGKSELDYGGSEPAHCECILVRANADNEDISPDDMQDAQSKDEQTPQRFFVPASNPLDAPRIPWNARRQEVFSYSSIAPAHTLQEAESASTVLPQSAMLPNASSEASRGEKLRGEGPRDEASRDLIPDADKATDLGSAFHRSAQYAIETGCRPDHERLARFAKTFALSEQATERLVAAGERWFTSSTWDEVTTWPERRAEVPFFVPVGDAFMEGDIDLLCTNTCDVPAPEAAECSTTLPGNTGDPTTLPGDTGDAGVTRAAGDTAPSKARGEYALVIDYKTGGTDQEDADTLHDKHRLQAQCYAFALLCQGYTSIELRFVRVERDDGKGNPQEVHYRYNRSDIQKLEQDILVARSELC